MSEFRREIPPALERILINKAHDSLDRLIMSLLYDAANEPIDYPVAATVLDKTGSMVLGEGVADDVKTKTPTGHAEANAIIAACLTHKEELTDGGIIISSVEPCNLCAEAIMSRLGDEALVASVASREEIEAVGHVNPRSGSYRDRTFKQINLAEKDTALREKSEALYLRGGVTRDPSTGITIVSQELLRQELERIGLIYRVAGQRR
jgi:tRNA(Arg) A34 adenosine deaminase TadA